MNMPKPVQPPFNTSFMGVVRGIADALDLPASTAMLYGGSGHAFVINMHRELCPSSPYCWDCTQIEPLLRNLGLERKFLSFLDGNSTAEQRRAVEARMVEELDAGHLAAVCNMDHQIATGHDQTGLLLTQPWGACKEFTPDRLSFGTWAEFGSEIHVAFYAFQRCEPAEPLPAVREALNFALKLGALPEDAGQSLYSFGPRAAYKTWIAGLQAGCGSTHGCWWNATVWSECRALGAEFFAEIANTFPSARSTADELSATYREIAAKLEKVSAKDLDFAEKVRLVEAARDLELQAVPRIQTLLGELPSA